LTSGFHDGVVADCCDARGGKADFHSLRHRFITELVKAGVQPKDAKELARHSTIVLTMDRYAHVTLQDSATALSKLTGPTARPLTLPLTLTPDDDRERTKAIGETRPPMPNPPTVAESLELEGIEDNRGVLGSGEGGIRTLVTVAGKSVFETDI